MLGEGRVECGGLGCTQLRSDGFGLRRSLSELGWDWLALCLCRFGWAGRVGRAGSRLYAQQYARVPLLLDGVEGVMATDITPGLRWLASPTTRQPTSHPANRTQPATYHTPRAHSFVSIATEWLYASPWLPGDVVSGGVWVVGPQRDSQTSQDDAVSRWLVDLHFRPGAMCSLTQRDEKAGGQITRPVHTKSILTVRRGNPDPRVRRRTDRVWGNRMPT